MPFENLTGDPSLDWAGLAVSGVVAQELNGSKDLLVFRAPVARAATLEQATETLEGYYDLRGGQLRFFGVLRNASTNRTIKSITATGTPAALAGAGDSIARELGGPVRPFPTQNPEALRAWGESQAAASLPAVAAALDRSILADPTFSTAYVDLAQLMRSANQPAEAAKVIERAKPHMAAFNEGDRARLNLVGAELSGNLNDRRAALVTLSQLYPHDPSTLRALTDADTRRRDFTSAAAFAKEALALRPSDTDLLNQLGYIEAYRGNLDAARESLERYRTLQPDQLNALDSLGEVHYFLGHFEEAEKYFLEAQSKNPAFLGGLEFAKAAQARLLRGDLPGADALFAKYVAPFQSNPRGAIVQAQWLYLTGRRREGMDAMTKLGANGGPISAYTATQQTIWLLEAGDREKANAAASHCLLPGAPPAAGAVCRALIDPAAPLPAGLTDEAAAYRDVLAGNFAQAVPLLKRLYERVDPSNDSEVRTLYAWALVKTGQVDQAAPLVETYPFPVRAGDLLFSSLEFPRFLAVRAAVREKQGRLAEAKSLGDLFEKYAPGSKP